MTKKDFIALADTIRGHNYTRTLQAQKFQIDHIEALAAFCRFNNPQFNRDRWLGYIRGECGPNGGAIHKPKGGTS